MHTYYVSNYVDTYLGPAFMPTHTHTHKHKLDTGESTVYEFSACSCMCAVIIHIVSSTYSVIIEPSETPANFANIGKNDDLAIEIIIQNTIECE